MKTLLLLASVFLTSSLWGSERTQFPSGLLQSFAGRQTYPQRFQDPKEIAQAFLKEELGQVRGEFHLSLKDAIHDKTHHHFTYEWKYGDRTVLDHHARVHVSSDGAVEMASNSLQMLFELPARREEPLKKAEFWKKKIYSDWTSKLGKFKGRVQADPVVWIEPKTHQGRAAVDIRVIIDYPWTLRHYIIEEDSGRVLEEKQVARNASASVKVFKKSPYGSSSPASVTLSDLTDTSSLRSSVLWVRREKINGSSTSSVEVEPQDYTAANFQNSPTPNQYNYQCTGDNTTCGNMSFDAVNAYYHLSNYRSRINSYFSQLGASVTFPYDAPKNSSTGATNTFSVLINPVSLDFGNPGLSDDVNNALYVGEPCRSDGSMERCLVFLRPAALASGDASSNCGTSSATLYDLSREAIVVAHEYQHYVTDTITHIAFSASGAPKVGDALHEAYSDYLAASYVSDLNGADVTLVGEYALSECTPLQRQLNTLRPYDDSDSANADPHTSGISWASAFWKLRTEFGVSVADLLAIKSLFFLSANPGFVESIEAVVKADQAVYQGAHVARIRTLFYSEVKFTGSASINPDGVADLGFKGCGAVHTSKPAQLGTLILFLTWLGSTVVVGRWRRKAV